MSDYTLYYWSLPFRGQFVRAVLAYAGRTWDEADDEVISKIMQGPVGAMPVPFMGPPLLIDHAADVAISQMPAILLYLGETLDLQPDTAASRALTLKVVNDANDLIDDLTLDGGRRMWSAALWSEFEPRLRKWMTVWEETGHRHGLGATSGFLLGGKKPGMADIVTATLWTTMTDRFPRLRALLSETAPTTAALSKRISALPPLAALAAVTREAYGDAWCGGKIETSLRKVLGA